MWKHHSRKMNQTQNSLKSHGLLPTCDHKQCAYRETGLIHIHSRTCWTQEQTQHARTTAGTWWVCLKLIAAMPCRPCALRPWNFGSVILRHTRNRGRGPKLYSDHLDLTYPLLAHFGCTTLPVLSRLTIYIQLSWRDTVPSWTGQLRYARNYIGYTYHIHVWWVYILLIITLYLCI